MTPESRQPAAPAAGGQHPVRPFRLLAVADSDSYLKFACATLESVGAGWEREVLLVRSPILPTLEQTQAATAGTFLAGKAPRVIPASGLRAALAGADVVLAAATGPIVEEIFTQASRMPRRPALVSALPGVAFPATRKALNYRALGDAFITHSHAECRAFSDLAEAMGLPQRILVSRLPFLASPGRPEPQQKPLDSVVFAPQAKVPVEREQRVAILQALAALARRRPELSVRVKLRAWAGEPQTHTEQYPFDQLWSDLVAARAVGGHELQFCTGPMSDQLTPGAAMVTVSSTAALEALDAGLPVLILDDFGLSEQMLNKVFDGSGLVGNLKDLVAGRFGHPDPRWLRDNYFHAQSVRLDEVLASFAVRARAGKLSTDPERLAAVQRRKLRSRLRTVLPAPALRLVRRLRNARRLPA
jgi:hypothetical protein